MVYNEVCRICLSVNVRMLVLRKTGLENLYKTLTNSFMDEDEGPIIVCFICHARLNRCRRLQQQAIESNAVLEQLFAGGSMSVPKTHEARDEIQFTPICHIDIRPVECDIENDFKDEIFSLDSIKVEEENFENEHSKFKENGNHETDIILTNNFSKPSEKKIKSNSTDSDIKNVSKGNLDFESPTIKSNLKVKTDNQPINKKGKHPAKIMKKKNLKQKSITKITSEASTKYIFECDDCSKIFLTKDILAKHISYRHKTQKNLDTVRTQVGQTPVPQLTDVFNCNICEFKTSRKRCILAHHKAHIAKQVYCCNNCDYKCTIKSSLIYHIKKHTDEKPFSCHICEYKCIQKTLLKRHIKIHTGEKPYSCNTCEYKCKRKSVLKRHIKIHTGEKPFSCHICEYKCIDNSTLRRHIITHTGDKSFTCNICEYRCIRKSNLQVHMKIHTGEKPFSCNYCEYKCITKSNLQYHIIKKHNGEKPFLCNICEFRCIRKNQLQKHLKIHTGEKPFSCHICEYKCIDKSTLRRHIITHTGDKSFTCNICEYRCIRKGNLQVHMKIHTGEKPFSCNICEYRCITKCNLQRHIKMHTGEKPFL